MPETQKLSRADREAQLVRMTLTAAGRDEILKLYKQHAGISQDAAPAAGTTSDEMIEAILVREYGQ